MAVAGWKGGFGKFIHIQQGDQLDTTMYGHLSRFAPGIRAWGKVQPGQLTLAMLALPDKLRDPILTTA